jgi:hypothetical protein
LETAQSDLSPLRCIKEARKSFRGEIGDSGTIMEESLDVPAKSAIIIVSTANGNSNSSSSIRPVLIALFFHSLNSILRVVYIRLQRL